MRAEMLSILSDVLCTGTGRPFPDMSGSSGRASWRDGGVCGTTSRKRIGRRLWSRRVHGRRSASDKWESSTLAGVSSTSGWMSCYINQYSINLNSTHGLSHTSIDSGMRDKPAMQGSWLTEGSAVTSTLRRLALLPVHFSLACCNAFERRFFVFEHVRLCLLYALGWSNVLPHEQVCQLFSEKCCITE